MRRFLDNGYCDIESILSVNVPFIFVIGGRGTGKTYGALKYALDTNTCIMLMRRTQAQTDLINKPEFSPFKPLEHDLRQRITVKAASKYNSVVYRGEDPDDLIGYTCALSTVANLRGFDASNVKLLIYDEFIAERHERPIKNEGTAFLNAYETMNRNRELKGKDPLQVLSLANAFDIANPIFRELDLISVCDKMKQKQNPVYVNKSRGVCIVMLDGSEISERKSKTALYKLTAGSQYGELALSNDFTYNSNAGIKPQHLREYKPVCGIGDIYIYKHKSKHLYYISEHASGNMPHYETDEVDLKRFIRHYGRFLYAAYMNERCIFESMLAKSTFEWYIV